jgi:uncharacterized membrane protein
MWTPIIRTEPVTRSVPAKSEEVVVSPAQDVERLDMACVVVGVSFTLCLLLFGLAAYAASVLVSFVYSHAAGMDLRPLWSFPLSALACAVWLACVGFSRRAAGLVVALIVTPVILFVGFLPSTSVSWNGYDSVAMTWLLGAGFTVVLFAAIMWVSLLLLLVLLWSRRRGSRSQVGTGATASLSGSASPPQVR